MTVLRNRDRWDDEQRHRPRRAGGGLRQAPPARRGGVDRLRARPPSARTRSPVATSRTWRMPSMRSPPPAWSPPTPSAGASTRSATRPAWPRPKPSCAGPGGAPDSLAPRHGPPRPPAPAPRPGGERPGRAHLVPLDRPGRRDRDGGGQEPRAAGPRPCAVPAARPHRPIGARRRRVGRLLQLRRGTARRGARRRPRPLRLVDGPPRPARLPQRREGAGRDARALRARPRGLAAPGAARQARVRPRPGAPGQPGASRWWAT